MTLRTSRWKEKECDVCGSSRVNQLDRRKFECSTRDGIYYINFIDSICIDCGNVFIYKTPEKQFLEEYYRSAYYYDDRSFSSYKPDYDASARIELLLKYLPRKSSVLEVGSNNGSFCNILADNGFSSYGVDLLEKDDRSMGGCTPELSYSYDAIVSYFVLEHIPFPCQWIQKLKEYSHRNTIFIFEIPDFEQYPMVSLNHEHFIHMTDYHLATMMNRLGFKSVYIGREYKSRYFGFCGVFVRDDSSHNFPVVSPIVKTYANNLNAYQNYKKCKEKCNKAIKLSIIKALESGNDIAVWGANRIASDLAHHLIDYGLYDIPIVDSNIQKQGRVHIGYKTPVKDPQWLEEQNRSFCVIICAQTGFGIIKKQISKMKIDNPTIIHIPIDMVCKHDDHFNGIDLKDNIG